MCAEAAPRTLVHRDGAAALGRANWAAGGAESGEAPGRASWGPGIASVIDCVSGTPRSRGGRTRINGAGATEFTGPSEGRPEITGPPLVGADGGE